MEFVESGVTQAGPRISFSGYPRVASPMLCILTRVRLRHAWQLFPAYLRFRQVGRQSRQSPGLLRFAFVIEFPRTFHTISIWQDDEAILHWDVPAHIRAVRWTFRRAEEIWSAEWRLSGLSPRTRWNG